jgi:hypothetical protein
MKTACSLRLPRFSGPCALAGAALTALLFVTSCATQRQVESIVGRSNAALLAGATGDIFSASPAGAGAAGSAATNADWRIVVAQIEEFAAIHTNDPALVAPLRVRAAMVLLQNGQVRQARDLFAFVGTNDLHSARDLALKSLAPSLVWWYSAAPGRFDRDDLSAARVAITNFTQQIDQLRDPADLSARDYLGVTRAWISLKLAHDDPDPTRSQMRFYFAEAFNRYGQMLTASELQAIATPPPPSSRTKLDVSDYRIAWGEALLAYGTNQFGGRIPFEGVTNAFRARLQPAP